MANRIDELKKMGLKKALEDSRTDRSGNRRIDKLTIDEAEELAKAHQCPYRAQHQRCGMPMPRDEHGYPLVMIDGRVVSTNPDHDCHKTGITVRPA